jgi:hypothetical protein
MSKFFGWMRYPFVRYGNYELQRYTLHEEGRCSIASSVIPTVVDCGAISYKDIFVQKDITKQTFMYRHYGTDKSYTGISKISQILVPLCHEHLPQIHFLDVANAMVPIYTLAKWLAIPTFSNASITRHDILCINVKYIYGHLFLHPSINHYTNKRDI